jgi:hypothetical protein
MRIKITVFLLLMATVVVPTVCAESEEFSVGSFEETVYKRGTVTFNNFLIHEDDGWLTPRGWHDLKIKLSAKNSAAEALSLGLQFVGKDKSGKILWAMSAAPMMGILSEKSLEEISGSVLVEPGTLGRTDKIVVIFAGES